MNDNHTQFNKPNNNRSTKPPISGSNASFREAIRAQKRSHEEAQRLTDQYAAAVPAVSDNPRRRANLIDDSPRLRIIGLGGMDGAGSKNMILVEYQNDAIVMDCGNDLGVDLPGINYAIADTTYLESIKYKLKAYVITHGHLDHIGGLPHILPKIPAPIYGSKFTIGRVEEIFQNFGQNLPESFELKTVTMNEDTHERLKIGQFFVELVRVTHSIPGSNCIILDTPVGRIINSGDFRFDPNPLDHERTDMERLIQLGNEGVLALLSESTSTERPGRTPSESILEPSFVELMGRAPGRMFIAIFSTNINRIQMIINAAVHHNRKIALDGRSMISTLEMAVRHGFVKIPKGTFVPIANVANLHDEDVVVVCTGGQGEPSSALQRMSTGDHKHIKLKANDTVVLSSSPIPETGNDALIGNMVDDLMRKGVHVFQHSTHELDGAGPLHVSGHASIDEYLEMIKMLKPKFFIPIYGSYRSKQRYIEVAIQDGFPRVNTINAENGQVINLTPDKMEVTEEVPNGTILVDQTGTIVSSVVVKDRVLLSEEGLVAVVLTIDKRTGLLLTSPDIISRGFIYMRDNEEMMNEIRNELRRAVTQRFKRVELDRFKQELREHITHFLFDKTQRSPIVIPVVNVIGGKGETRTVHGERSQSTEDLAAEQERRFQEMRSRLLAQDARID
ncbi:MAG TPA: ribonuclease J [Patescibacteria group bacterium]|jgi:ribonuclease J|nr:ribonuclease J [Patescibacteria group bacterium]